MSDSAHSMTLFTGVPAGSAVTLCAPPLPVMSSLSPCPFGSCQISSQLFLGRHLAQEYLSSVCVCVCWNHRYNGLSAEEAMQAAVLGKNQPGCHSRVIDETPTCPDKGFRISNNGATLNSGVTAAILLLASPHLLHAKPRGAFAGPASFQSMP